MRGNNIGLLNYLLGFNQPGAPWNPQQPQQPQQGGMPQHQAPMPGVPQGGMNFGLPGLANPGGYGGGGQNYGGGPQGGMGPGGLQGLASVLQGGGMSATPQPTGGPSPVLRPTGGGTPGNTGFATQQFNGPQMNAQAGSTSNAPNDMLGRMESYFGPLGTPTSPLQQQSMGGISQFLNSDPYGQSNNWLSHAAGGQGYQEANQAYRNVGNQDYFGGAQGAFGKAGSAFGNVGKQNYFGGAEGVFNRLEGFNPFGAAQGSMEGILGANPGQGMLEALRPHFERNMAAANQTGGRFGSANAIMRSRALDDYNLLGAQALQRGTDQQIAAAGQYGAMGNSLIGARSAAGQGLLGVGQGRLSQGLGAAQGQLGVGQGMLGVGQGRLGQGLGVAGGLGGLAAALQGDRLNAAGQMAQNQNSLFNANVGAYGVGQQQAQQDAQRQQQALQILLGQLGVSQGATLGADNVVTPTGAQQGAQLGTSIGQILAMYGGGNKI
jgi:hypothetical protein